MPVGNLDYTLPPTVIYNTTPSLSPSGPATHTAEAAAHRAMLSVGMHVAVRPGIPNVGGKSGLIVSVGDSGSGDCMVLLDLRSRPLGFYWHELVISISPEPGSRILPPGVA